MKKIILTLSILWIAVTVFAKDNKPKKTPEQKAKEKTSELVTTLKLNKDQETKLYTTHLTYYQTTDAYEAKNPSKKDKKKFKDRAQAERDADYKKILTPAQLKQFAANEKAEDVQKEKEKKEKKEEKKKQKDAEKKVAPKKK